MFKHVLKVAIVVVLLGGAGAALAFAVWLHGWSKGATVYAKGFKKEAFVGIPLGTAMAEVEKVLGKPLSAETQDVSETWLYFSPEGSRGLYASSGPMKNGTILLLEEPRVTFGPSGLVESAVDLGPRLASARNPTGQQIAPGDAKGKVLTLLGEPYMRRTGGQFTTWRYSRPKGPNDSFEAVTLLFSADGRLVQKYDQFLAD